LKFGPDHCLLIRESERVEKLTVHGTVIIIIIVSAVHVSGGFSAHHQELIKLFLQPWVLSCFPAIYRWCGWWQYLRLRKQFYKFLMMGGKTD
jgi:hypothetical protein